MSLFKFQNQFANMGPDLLDHISYKVARLMVEEGYLF